MSETNYSLKIYPMKTIFENGKIFRSLNLLLLVIFISSCTRPVGTPIPVTLSSVVHSISVFQVFILTPLTTCLVGNEFASGNVCAGTECGDCSCSPEVFDPPTPQTGVSPDRINDPQYASYQHKICLDITLSEDEIAAIEADMDLVHDQAFKWSGGALDLQMQYTILPAVFTGFTAPDFVIGPFEIDDELLDAYVTRETDFIYVVTGNSDPIQGLHLAAWCGSAYGELSIHGSNYAYVQYNHGSCNSITLDGKQVYEPLIHEWMHGLDWSLYNINGVADAYQFDSPDWVKWKHASWPACGTGSQNPLDWFPSVDLCEWDPDWQDCSNTASAGTCTHAGEVNGGVSWYEHVISAHYPQYIQFLGNYCRDGRQDFSETGVDTGWPCPTAP
jgi:hypothetical protein